jgi:hypothetical protein
MRTPRMPARKRLNERGVRERELSGSLRQVALFGLPSIDGLVEVADPLTVLLAFIVAIVVPLGAAVIALMIVRRKATGLRRAGRVHLVRMFRYEQ